MRLAAFVTLVSWAGLCSLVAAEERPPVVPTFLMDTEPEEKVQPEPFFLHPELFGLWKSALARPETEMRRRTAEAIAIAHQEGHEGLMEFQTDLVNVLQQEKPNSTARYAAAHALIELNCRDSAAALFEASQADGKDMHQLVEPILAEWGFAPIQEVWTKRLQSPDTPRRELVLAIRGLAKSGVSAAQSDILRLTMNAASPPDIRLAAAKAAGELSDSGLENSAQQLIARDNSATIDRLCAASLLVKHRSPQAIELNTTLAKDSEPAVVGIALQTLYSTDSQLVLPLADDSLKSIDAPVRRIAIEAYLKHPTAERNQTLVTHLNDPHPELRALVREGFITLRGVAEFSDQILELSIQALNGDDWRGQEQSALLMAVFERKETAPRLGELLKSTRIEPGISSAWALRVLAVPESAADLTAQLEKQTNLPSTFFESEIETQICHLCEALAVLKHKPATPIMERYIPKQNRYSPLARSAAIWALGQIYQDVCSTSEGPEQGNALTKAAEFLGVKEQSDVQIGERLAEAFMDRVEDTESQDPEAEPVRRTCALAIGHIKAASQIEALQLKLGDEVNNNMVDLAMRWAIKRMTGEELPIAPIPSYERIGWFLEPINREKTRKLEIPK